MSLSINLFLPVLKSHRRWARTVCGANTQGTHRARTAHPHVVSHARDLVRSSVGDVISRGSSAVSPQNHATLVDAGHDGRLRAKEPEGAGEDERTTSANEGEDERRRRRKINLVLGEISNIKTVLT